MEPVYRPVVGFALTLFKVMRWNIRTTGEHHVPSSGPAVIATNHVGYLDFVFVGAAARKRGRLVRFLAKHEVFAHPVAGPLMRGMKHIPVDRYGRARDAIEASVEALRSGEVVGMFPEGTISRSFVPADGRSGAARMAMEAGAPLIPGAVWGTQRILTKGRPKNWQRNITITVDLGAPIPYDATSDPDTVTKRLMEVIEEMVQRAAVSYPDEPSDADDRWWLPAHLGGSAPTVDESLEMARAEREERARRRRTE
jgi:1-acyl-sn-glycerol-3-phosphate acyltransferase